jgi:hypothetical protein
VAGGSGQCTRADIMFHTNIRFIHHPASTAHRPSTPWQLNQQGHWGNTARAPRRSSYSSTMSRGWRPPPQRHPSTCARRARKPPRHNDPNGQRASRGQSGQPGGNRVQCRSATPRAHGDGDSPRGPQQQLGHEPYAPAAARRCSASRSCSAVRCAVTCASARRQATTISSTPPAVFGHQRSISEPPEGRERTDPKSRQQRLHTCQGLFCTRWNWSSGR